MSEKIAQLNREVIKGQIKELVWSSVEETLNELLEVKTQKLPKAAWYECNEQHQSYCSGHWSRSFTTISGNVSSRYSSAKDLFLRSLSLSGITAGKAERKRFSLRYIWQAYPSGVWRTSPRRCGTAKCLPLPWVSWTKKRMFTLMVGAIVPC